MDKIHEDFKYDSTFFLDKNLELTHSYNYVHCHTACEIGICVTGNGLFLLNDRIYTYGKGDITIALPNDMHISNCNDNQTSVWHYITIDLSHLPDENINVHLELSRLFSEHSLSGGVFTQKKHPALHRYINLLLDELSEQSTDWQDCSFHLLVLIFLELFRIADRKKHTLAGSPIDAKQYKMIAPAISLITAGYHENLSVKDLANACFISETHMRRLFKEVLKLSPMEYLYKTRITASKSLLKSTNLSIIEISQQVGYQAQTSFNSHFKKFVGITPTAYRKKFH